MKKTIFVASMLISVFALGFSPMVTHAQYGGGGGMYIPAVVTAVHAPGNLKGSGVVNEYDLAMLMSNWSTTGSNPADLNKDGVVNEYDFAILMANWGK